MFLLRRKQDDKYSQHKVFMKQCAFKNVFLAPTESGSINANEKNKNNKISKDGSNRHVLFIAVFFFFFLF